MVNFEILATMPSEKHDGVEITMQYDSSNNEISFWQHDKINKISKRIGQTYQYQPNYEWFYNDKMVELFSKQEIKNRLVW